MNLTKATLSLYKINIIGIFEFIVMVVAVAVLLWFVVWETFEMALPLCVFVCVSVIRDICLFHFYMFSKIQEQMDINKCDAHNTTAVFSNWIMEFVPQRERFSIFQFSGFGLVFGLLSMAGNLFIIIR